MANLTLPGSVQQARPGVSGFDINSPVSASQAAALKAEGYSFCIRYIPRTANLIPGNLTNEEAATILNAGLALMAVQHVSLPGWQPTTNLGTAYGNYAATYAKQNVGLPVGMNIWCDLEGVAPGTPAANVIAYCQAWYNAVHSAGYVPGLYVGYDAILTSQQLYDEISFQHYWRAYNGPQVATRGFQLVQKTEKDVSGITIDPDISQMDGLGDNAIWLSL
jgi:hypothetical protein